MAMRQILSLAYWLETKGVPRMAAIYAESRLKGLEERGYRYDYKQGFLDLFRPIGGHDKGDVFTDGKK